MGEKKRLLLIDGHALAYRAYHAIQPLTSPSGQPTNAVYGASRPMPCTALPIRYTRPSKTWHPIM